LSDHSTPWHGRTNGRLWRRAREAVLTKSIDFGTLRSEIETRVSDDQLASFHLKRLLNGATGTRIVMD
jgi:hypothetical protein